MCATWWFNEISPTCRGGLQKTRDYTGGQRIRRRRVPCSWLIHRYTNTLRQSYPATPATCETFMFSLPVQNRVLLHSIEGRSHLSNTMNYRYQPPIIPNQSSLLKVLCKARSGSWYTNGHTCSTLHSAKVINDGQT